MSIHWRPEKDHSLTDFTGALFIVNVCFWSRCAVKTYTHVWKTEVIQSTNADPPVHVDVLDTQKVSLIINYLNKECR